MLLYGTEEPAQPSDQRYSPYAPNAFRRPGIGQQLTSQVGQNRRISGGGGIGRGGGQQQNNWWQQPPPPPVHPPQSHQWNQQFSSSNPNPGGGGGAQFSSNSLFGNIIRQLSRLVNNRRDA